MTLRRILLLSLVFVALTAVMTFPQVLHMRDAVHDDGDPLLNAWTLAWVAHQLPNAPAHLFDANIFYPERRTLAYSETLLAPAVFAAPLRMLGAGPILVHNVVFLSGFVVSGVGAALLAHALIGRLDAALIAGIVFAFLPFRIDHYPHLQLQQTQFLPFVFLAFHRLLHGGRMRDGGWLGISVAGQILSCMYYGLFLVPFAAIVCGTMLIAWSRDGGTGQERVRFRSVVVGLAIAAAIVSAVAIPVGRAYYGAKRVVGERSRDEVAAGSATWRDYLVPPDVNRLYGGRLAPFGLPERRLFPGFVACALAIVALMPRRGARTIRGLDARWAYAVGLLFAFDASLGFNGFTYRWLYEFAAPFRGLRIPARMGMMAGFSLAMLAGYGAARIGGWLPSVGARRVVLALVAVLALAEYVSRPIPLQPIPREPPASYADLARDRGDSPDVAIAEFPMSPRDDLTYMYYSTFHWQALVNGYSGFFPPSYGQLLYDVRGFPDETSIGAVKARGVRYVLVHGERMIAERYAGVIATLDRRADLQLVSRRPAQRYRQHGEISLYRVQY